MVQIRFSLKQKTLQNRLFGYRDAIFALFSTIVILWQMLLPGYVLTLDLAWGPLRTVASLFSPQVFNTFPISALIYVIQLVLSGWVVEKMMLFGLCFALFYIPLIAYPLISRFGERYVAALFFAINPFVYERLLAGQWLVLAGYCVLPLLFKSLVVMWRDRSWRAMVMPFVWLVCIGLFSLHLLVMSCILYAIWWAAVLLRGILRDPASVREFIIRSAGGVALFLVVSMYWTFPYLLHPAAAPINGFDPSQWAAFATAASERVGVLGNVATLYGFWGEHEAWARQFLWPKVAEGMWWHLSAGAFLGVVALGAWIGLRRRESRSVVTLLLVGAIIAVIFSAGLGGGVTYGLNAWLFEHVWFWKGFRDTEKWSTVVACVYAIFAGIASGYFLERVRASLRPFLFIALCLVPIFYAPTLLFGLMGQVQPVWYPSEWAQVDAVLKQDTTCKALFLPWHQYYSLGFDHGLSVGNVSGSYFDCSIVSAQNIELDDSDTPTGYDQRYYTLQSALINNEGDPDAVARILTEQGIDYVIATPDALLADPYSYPLLRSKKLTPIVTNPVVDLYRVSQ